MAARTVAFGDLIKKSRLSVDETEFLTFFESLCLLNLLFVAADLTLTNCGIDCYDALLHRHKSCAPVTVQPWLKHTNEAILIMMAIEDLRGSLRADLSSLSLEASLMPPTQTDRILAMKQGIMSFQLQFMT